jgi:26S proteasome regulatory subunit N10
MEANADILEKFIAAVDNSENSHLLSVPPGPNILSDLLLSSPIIQEEGGAVIANPASFEFGVDPSLDPELAMVCVFSWWFILGIADFDGGGTCATGR